ncbi:Crp/Fnr family transcriptional regulator [Solimonas soli]|uniref:Crp/Fnr family transcriptional regulator n=1 Tax=Solimonas soli TaxID=413479 RepID=UPI000A056001|nr:Crp/Fnr family transcriptional regulator [Solimonas soli]
MTTAIGPSSNRLLAQLLRAIGVATLAPQLTKVKLKAGQVLHEAGVTISYVYFPVDALVSLLQVMANGAATEMAIVGCDGMIGSELMLGVDRTTSRAVVHCEGHAYRLSIEVFMQALQRSPTAQRMVLASARALMVQTAQTVACNRHHSLNQQLCRWLLLGVDRMPGNELRVTHENLGHALGVRRESVTLAASKLREAGAIQYSRGLVRILDRRALENEACECYRIVTSECERLRSAAENSDALPSVLQRTDGASALPDIAAHRSEPTHDAPRSTNDRRRGDRRSPTDRRVRQVAVAFADRRVSGERRGGAASERTGSAEKPPARGLAG